MGVYKCCCLINSCTSQYAMSKNYRLKKCVADLALNKINAPNIIGQLILDHKHSRWKGQISALKCIYNIVIVKLFVFGKSLLLLFVVCICSCLCYILC